MQRKWQIETLKQNTKWSQQTEKLCYWQIDKLLETRGMVFMHSSFEMALSIFTESGQTLSPETEMKNVQKVVIALQHFYVI